MKIPKIIKTFSPIEIFLIIIFIIYIIFPISTPSFMANSIDSPLGMIVIFCITLFLFIYTNPVLAIIYVFVAYELLRRTSLMSGKTTIYVTNDDNNNPVISYPMVSSNVNNNNNINSMQKKDIQNANIHGTTLEEEIITIKIKENMKTQTKPLQSTENNFQPVSGNLIPGTSLL